MIYRLNFTSQDPKPPHRHYRTGKLSAVIINGKALQLEKRMPIISEILENFELIDGIKIETKFYKNSNEPYPDFITIDIALYAVNNDAKQFLDHQQIKYQIKPIEIINEHDFEYFLILFPTKDLINIEASNGYINKQGRLTTLGKNYFDSNLVLKEEAKDLKGIFRLNKLGNVLICDEETKIKLEKSGLTGFSFDKLEIS